VFVRQSTFEGLWKEAAMLNRLSSQFDFNAESLKLRSERQRIIASNIANADTPGYQSRDVDFKAALQEATRNVPKVASSPATLGEVTRATSATRTNALHAASLGVTFARTGESQTPLQYRLPAQGAFDGNTVDVDRETANFAENTVRYEAALRFLNGQIKTMNLALTGQ
jgi:flagellar basal-body rod protein FlgB